MESAKLIKNLERLGFELDYDTYESYDEMIIEILKSKNPRLYPSITLLLNYFDYNKIIQKLNEEELKEFQKIIRITSNIYFSKKLDELIKKEKINDSTWKKDYEYYKERYEESMKKRELKESKKLDLNTELRTNIDTNQALRILFKPGKIKILNKIFTYEELSKTDTNYYYRSIKPTINAVLTPTLQKYLNIIEKIKSKR